MYLFVVSRDCQVNFPGMYCSSCLYPVVHVSCGPIIAVPLCRVISRFPSAYLERSDCASLIPRPPDQSLCVNGENCPFCLGRLDMARASMRLPERRISPTSVEPSVSLTWCVGAVVVGETVIAIRK